MADEEHLNILKQGVEVWNKWREQNEHVWVDLSAANLSGAALTGVNLTDATLKDANLERANLDRAVISRTNLSGANLRMASLREAFMVGVALANTNLDTADLTGANLRKAFMSGANLDGALLVATDLREAILTGAHLRGAAMMGADLSGADLFMANLIQVDLTEANLSGARLERAALIGTRLAWANLSRCHIFGISAWGLELDGAVQSDLVITEDSEPAVTVDNLEIAQFIYLLLHNEKIRDVIDTIGKKAVLILGRFTQERKAVLDALREELRERNYMPILFDFEKPASKDLTETISTLAHLSRFIIADITDAKSIPQELQAIVPNLPSVAIQPIVHADGYEYAMFDHFKRYPWVLPVYQYEDQMQLIAVLSEKVIDPAEKKVEELRSSR